MAASLAPAPWAPSRGRRFSMRLRARALFLIEQYLLLAARKGGGNEPGPAGRVRDSAPALSAAKAENFEQVTL